MKETPSIALVAGGGRGIGYAICQRLAADGHTIVAAARSIDELNQLKEELIANGQKIYCHEFDIADNESVDSLIKEIVVKHGRIDVLVNSAGTSYVAPVALSNIEKSEYVVRVNLLGAYFLSRAVVRIMIRQRQGRIVHIGSISGTIGAAYNAIYAASKAGIAGLVKSMALEVGKLGITVNAVQPGTVETALFEQTHGARAKIKGISLEQQRNEVECESPINRLVTTEEVAHAVAFLVSDRAASVNGHLLNIDGGRSIQ